MTAQHDIASSDSGLAELLAAIDGEIAEELRREQQQAGDSGSAKALEEIGRYLCFTLAGQHLAVPLSSVIEVGELETVRPLPFLPDWAEGVTNIRGEIVSVTNLAVFFQIAGRFTRKNRLAVILHEGGMKTAVIIDKITGTHLLYKKEGLTGNGVAAIPVDFLSGPALFMAENGENRLELFNSGKLLAALRLQ
ncbi:chemotaxis protein CheW [Candidatus Electronema sp. PJ]|uniref:chemotaxis protein CheW n=1 Tax=Candidatus Electronema sp. PJ TaxID=3401572 RepID=UPI003AA80A4F